MDPQNMKTLLLRNGHFNGSIQSCWWIVSSAASSVTTKYGIACWKHQKRFQKANRHQRRRFFQRLILGHEHKGMKADVTADKTPWNSTSNSMQNGLWKRLFPLWGPSCTEVDSEEPPNSASRIPFILIPIHQNSFEMIQAGIDEFQARKPEE